LTAEPLKLFLLTEVSATSLSVQKSVNSLKLSSGIYPITLLLKISQALQELGYEVTIVKQMTAKCPFLEGGVTCISLPLFLVTLVRSQKSQVILKITNLCNIIVKVDAHKSQKGLTQCYNCQHYGHIWLHCWQPRCLWCGGGQCHR
jgi:hypothetical protein